jgi:hypothetical protein
MSNPASDVKKYIPLIVKGKITIYPKWTMHPSYDINCKKDKLWGYAYGDTKKPNGPNGYTMYYPRNKFETYMNFMHSYKPKLNPVEMAEHLSTLKCLPIKTHFDIDIPENVKHMNDWGELIVLEDKYLKDEPFEIDGTWHIYMVGGGDGGFLYFEEYIEDNLFRQERCGWVYSIDGNIDTQPKCFRVDK